MLNARTIEFSLVFSCLGELHTTPSLNTKDTKICGEAETQPTLRLPPLREGRHNKLFAAAIALRYDAELSSLRAGDAIVFMDGGRDGALK